MRVFQTPTPPTTCFFCLSTLDIPPRNPNAFKCPHCSCWNRYDNKGEIVSDEPAMRDESMNTASFAKRASPSKHRLPTAYSKGPFCHTCSTNQTLIINILSNYLPSPDDPSYETRAADLPAYEASLQERYPPVCKDCQPIIEEDLQKKEHMARTTALGGWLKRSQHAGSQRTTELQRGKRDVSIWKLRGALWAVTLTVYVSVDIAGMLRYDLIRPWLALSLLPSAIISLLWTFWDPTWSTLRTSRLQGRTFSVSGRERYIYCQMLIWFSRLVTSCLIIFEYFDKLPNYVTPYHSRCWYTTALAMETVLSAFSLSNLYIQRPPKVRLLEPKDKSRVFSRAAQESRPEPLLASLSLTPQVPAASLFAPAVSTNPIFGQPSFPMPVPDIAKEDVMDWTPTKPQGAAATERVQDREDWMRPQRFFPPEQPTGLEDLFQKAKLDAEERSGKQTQQQQQQPDKANSKLREVGLYFAVALTIALVAGLGVYQF